MPHVAVLNLFNEFVLIGLLYMTYPNGCQHRCTSPAEAKALPREGTSALVMLQ